MSRLSEALKPDKGDQPCCYIHKNGKRCDHVWQIEVVHSDELGKVYPIGLCDEHFVGWTKKHRPQNIN